MNADAGQELVNEITAGVIGCAYRVGNSLGPGFLEKVYESALAVQLRHQHLPFTQQPSYLVRYREEIDALTRVHHAQCMNYLRATNLRVALLLNFGGPRVETKRFVWQF